MTSLRMDAAALTDFLATEFPQVAGDVRIQSVTEKALVVRMVMAARHQRPGGTISGPALFALADVTIYLAILSRIGPVGSAMTTNCAIDFMRKPPAAADLTATARLLKLGRVLAVGDVLIDAAGIDGPVARASLTYSIPPRGD